MKMDQFELLEASGVPLYLSLSAWSRIILVLPIIRHYLPLQTSVPSQAQNKTKETKKTRSRPRRDAKKSTKLGFVTPAEEFGMVKGAVRLGVGLGVDVISAVASEMAKIGAPGPAGPSSGQKLGVVKKPGLGRNNMGGRGLGLGSNNLAGRGPGLGQNNLGGRGLNNLAGRGLGLGQNNLVGGGPGLGQNNLGGRGPGLGQNNLVGRGLNNLGGRGRGLGQNNLAGRGPGLGQNNLAGRRLGLGQNNMGGRGPGLGQNNLAGQRLGLGQNNLAKRGPGLKW